MTFLYCIYLSRLSIFFVLTWRCDRSASTGSKFVRVPPNQTFQTWKIDELNWHSTFLTGTKFNEVPLWARCYKYDRRRDGQKEVRGPLRGRQAGESEFSNFDSIRFCWKVSPFLIFSYSSNRLVVVPSRLSSLESIRNLINIRLLESKESISGGEYQIVIRCCYIS